MGLKGWLDVSVPSLKVITIFLWSNWRDTDYYKLYQDTDKLSVPHIGSDSWHHLDLSVPLPLLDIKRYHTWYIINVSHYSSSN